MLGYLLHPCKSKAAFEALPNTKGRIIQLDLQKSSTSLENFGYEIICDAKVMVVLKKDLEVTLYPSGKMILKTHSRAVAEQVMNEIYDAILNI